MILVTAPTVEPITLTEVKSQLGITDTASDTVLTRRITEARQWVEGDAHISLMPQTLEMRFDAFQSEFELKRPPVTAVSSLKYIDIGGVLQTVAAADYELDTFPLLPYVRPAYAVSWPSPRAERNAVRLQYTAGYAISNMPGVTAKTITGITKATPGVITSAGHGFTDGDLILLDIAGMTELDGGLYRVYAKGTDTFQLANLANNGAISTAAFTTFTSGTVIRVQSAVPDIIKDAMITLVGHWTSYQNRMEQDGFIRRIPLAVEQMIDSERVPHPS